MHRRIASEIETRIMGKAFFLPVSIGGGLLAGLIGKKLFGLIWGVIDDEAPPGPEYRNILAAAEPSHSWSAFSAAVSAESST